MAGHSKWANIKHRKAAQDAKRSKVFTKLLKEITVAAREGGPDEESNARLRLAVRTAKKNSVPKDTIERAVKKGAGGDGGDYKEVTYEGYAPNGVAVFVEAATDNINRTVANVRSIFNKSGGNLGTNGSVDYMFERKGVFTIKEEDVSLDEDDFMLEVIDGGAEDVEHEEGFYIITCALEDYGNVNSKLEELNVEAENSELSRIPMNTIELGVEDAQKVLKVIDKLEDDDDVQKVFHNLEMTDALAEALSS